MSDPAAYAGIQVQGLTLEKLARLTSTTFNVKTFGAVADGTDDSAGIQAAIDALPAAGGIVYCPDGDYRLETGLVIQTPSVQFIGSGRWACTLTAAADIVPITLAAGATYPIVRGFKITQNFGGHSKSGVVVAANTRTILDELFILSMGDHGIDWQLGNAGAITNVRSDGNGGDGIHIEDLSVPPTDVMAGWAENLDLINNTGNGLNIVNAIGWDMKAVTAQQNTLNGVRINSARNRVAGWAESNTLNDVLLDTSARANIIDFINTAGVVVDNGAFNMVLTVLVDPNDIGWQGFRVEDLIMRRRVIYRDQQGFTDLDTTPSVLSGNYFFVNNSAATSITDFNDGSEGQLIIVDTLNGNTTFVHGINTIRMSGGIDFTAPTGRTMMFISDGARWHEISRDGGHQQSVDGWYQDDVAPSQTTVLLARAAAGAAPDALVVTRDGSVTRVIVRSNEARTAGTLTVEVFINGTGTGLTAVLNATDTTFKVTIQAPGLDTFVAGAEIDLRITTDASWAPTTADIRASLELET